MKKETLKTIKRLSAIVNGNRPTQVYTDRTKYTRKRKHRIKWS